MSGSVAHDLSGLLRLPLEVMDEEDSISGGDPEDAFEEAYLGWSESQLTQEQAANDK
jgi:hypothetical protein